MADSVRRILEEMVPELEDLEKKGYFSRTEIRQIIQKRQDFEYNLQRRATVKDDFVRSIDYEKSLEKLRVLRKKQRHIQGKSTDYSIVRRTHKLYERMLRKFKGDLSLWNDWIQFCAVTKSSRQMSSVLTRVMQLFPNSAAVWTYAASWELEHNNNATTARSLMQTGIRMCKDNPSLWVEYFRMELLYAARLGARRKILGVEESIDDATKALLSGGVAKVVYLNAVKSLPEDFDVRLKCLKAIQPLSIMDKEVLEDFILQNILEECSREDDGIWLGLSHYLFARARSGGASLQDAVDTAIQIFTRDTSIAIVRSKMIFLETYFHAAIEADDDIVMSMMLDEIIQTGEDALKRDIIHEDIILRLSGAYQRVGKFKDILSSVPYRSSPGNTVAVERSCLKAFDDFITREENTHIVQGFMKLEVAYRTDSLWFTMISLFSDSRSSLLSLAKQFEKDQLASVTQPADSVRGLVAVSIMNALHLLAGIDEARDFYNSILKCPLPGAAFAIEIGKLEQSLVSRCARNALSADAFRQMYNSAISVYGSDSVDLWLEYYLFEVSLGKEGSPGIVHWRARESLEDPDAFVLKSNLASQSADIEVW